MPFRKQSYDALPALSIRGPTLRWCLRRVTMAWAIGMVWITIYSSPLCFPQFGKMLGLGNFSFGVYSAIPFAAAFFQLWATLLIERTGLTKFQFLAFGTAHRVMFILIALIPVALPLPSLQATIAVLGLLLISYSFEAFSRPAWTTWMGVLIPPRIRGRYMAKRTQITMWVQIAVALGMGFLLSHLKDANAPMTWAAQRPLGIAISGLLVVAGICGVIDILMFRRIPEVITKKDESPDSPLHPQSLKRRGGRVKLVRYLLFDPMRNVQFRRFVLYSMCTTFAATIGGVFYALNMLQNVVAGWEHGPLITVILFTVLGPLAAIASAPITGRGIDKYGKRPVMVLATIVTLFSVMPWFFMGPGMPPWLLITLAGLAPVLGYMGWGGVIMGQFNIVIGFADGDGRSRYVAASQLYISVGGLLGGVVGGCLAHTFSFMHDTPVYIGPFLYNNWHVVFAASFLMRIPGIVLAARLQEPGSTRARTVAMAAGSRAVTTVYGGLSYPLRLFGWRMNSGWRPPPDTPPEDH